MRATRMMLADAEAQLRSRQSGNRGGRTVRQRAQSGRSSRP
jgi:hypothetical protein